MDTLCEAQEDLVAVSFVVNFPEHSCPTEITILPQRSPKSMKTQYSQGELSCR